VRDPDLIGDVADEDLVVGLAREQIHSSSHQRRAPLTAGRHYPLARSHDDRPPSMQTSEYAVGTFGPRRFARGAHAIPLLTGDRARSGSFGSPIQMCAIEHIEEP